MFATSAKVLLPFINPIIFNQHPIYDKDKKFVLN